MQVSTALLKIRLILYSRFCVLISYLLSFLVVYYALYLAVSLGGEYMHFDELDNILVAIILLGIFFMFLPHVLQSLEGFLK